MGPVGHRQSTDCTHAPTVTASARATRREGRTAIGRAEKMAVRPAIRLQDICLLASIVADLRPVCGGDEILLGASCDTTSSNSTQMA
jgi:hypothetical protein